MYLVPATLGAVAYTATRRGEFGRLMSYESPARGVNRSIILG